MEEEGVEGEEEVEEEGVERREKEGEEEEFLCDLMYFCGVLGKVEKAKEFFQQAKECREFGKESGDEKKKGLKPSTIRRYCELLCLNGLGEEGGEVLLKCGRNELPRQSVYIWNQVLLSLRTKFKSILEEEKQGEKGRKERWKEIERVKEKMWKVFEKLRQVEEEERVKEQEKQRKDQRPSKKGKGTKMSPNKLTYTLIFSTFAGDSKHGTQVLQLAEKLLHFQIRFNPSSSSSSSLSSKLSKVENTKQKREHSLTPQTSHLSPSTPQTNQVSYPSTPQTNQVSYPSTPQTNQVSDEVEEKEKGKGEVEENLPLLKDTKLASSMLKVFCVNGRMESAWSVLKEQERCGVTINHVCYHIFLKHAHIHQTLHFLPLLNKLKFLSLPQKKKFPSKKKKMKSTPTPIHTTQPPIPPTY